MRVFSKTCKWCGKNASFWSELNKCFTETPDGERHQCQASSKQNQDQKLNETINDLKSQMSIQHTDEVQRIDSLQRSIAHLTSLVQEIKFKVDAALRNG